MVSAGKGSWAVAAGVAAVEAMKDQVGLCRWNYAFKTLQQHAKNTLKSSTSKPTTTNQARMISGALDQSSAIKAGSDYSKKREAEKAENVMHLVCWGPN